MFILSIKYCREDKQQLQINNCFIPRAILKCNMSIASVLLTILTAYYIMHANVYILSNNRFIHH